MEFSEVPTDEAMEWAKGIEVLDTDLLNELFDAPYNSGDAVRAEAAMYAITFASMSKTLLPNAVLRLLDIIDDNNLPTPVRAQAVEAVGNQLFGVRSGVRKEAVRQLTHHLEDPTPEIRFWAAFALATIGDKTALPRLREMTTDKTLVPGWWTVGEEAEDAVTVLLGGQWPDRPMHGRDEA